MYGTACGLGTNVDVEASSFLRAATGGVNTSSRSRSSASIAVTYKSFGSLAMAVPSASGSVEEDGEHEEERVRGGVGVTFRAGLGVTRVPLRELDGLRAMGAIGFAFIFVVLVVKSGGDGGR